MHCAAPRPRHVKNGEIVANGVMKRNRALAGLSSHCVMVFLFVMCKMLLQNNIITIRATSLQSLTQPASVGMTRQTTPFHTIHYTVLLFHDSSFGHINSVIIITLLQHLHSFSPVRNLVSLVVRTCIKFLSSSLALQPRCRD